MGKMTLKQMYKGCEKMWSELSENGNYIKPSTTLFNNCYACEYVKQKYRFRYFCYSNPCPMEKLWGYKSTIENVGCEKGNSPYNKWRTSLTSGDRKRYAKIIADFCRKELKKIEKKKHSKQKVSQKTVLVVSHKRKSKTKTKKTH